MFEPITKLAAARDVVKEFQEQSMSKRKNHFLRVIEEKRDAVRQQEAAPEEANEDAETPRRPPWLASKRRRAPWK
jgi:hypothetical protein